jgi:hypothetical protein
MANSKTPDIKVITERPVGQKREYSTYVEISTNPREVTLKFCDLKPASNPEELERVTKAGQITIPVNTEIVLPIDVAEGVLNILKQHLENLKKN